MEQLFGMARSWSSAAALSCAWAGAFLYMVLPVFLCWAMHEGCRTITRAIPAAAPMGVFAIVSRGVSIVMWAYIAGAGARSLGQPLRSIVQTGVMTPEAYGLLLTAGMLATVAGAYALRSAVGAGHALFGVYFLCCAPATWVVLDGFGIYSAITAAVILEWGAWRVRRSEERTVSSRLEAFGAGQE